MTASARPARPLSPLVAFLLGWGIGVGVFLLLRGVGLALLSGPCEGRTTLALLAPLLLGPGGLAFTASNWARPRRAALGLGLVVASFLPALAVGARDIGVLRATGCAGGYVVVTPASGGKSVSELNVRAGQTLNFTARVGGYTPQTHPGEFRLSTRSPAPGLALTLQGARARAGESVPLRLTVAPNTPPNTYTVGVQATQESGGQAYTAEGTLTVNVLR
ncbi:hypothetical protein [Deinococcus planocerae]|uniref:hypothetical protein n=1 Tax=Deinococcus planocerae TaxID=1737569 RepID=UPI000C7F5717|nr:hypothetical protein [Deinococcus planocerae]